MTQSFHPSAAARFNELAADLRNRVTDLRTATPGGAASTSGRDASFISPEVPIAAALTDKDIVGGITERQLDTQGREVALRFLSPNASYAIEGEAYQSLVRLATQMQRSPSLRHRVSLASVTHWLFEWLVATDSDSVSSMTMTDCLLQKVAESLASQSFVFPVHEVHAQDAFTVGGVEFRPLTAEELNGWLAANVEEHDKEHRGAFVEAFERRRRRVQGRVAARITVEAEPEYAYTLALRSAETAVAILRLISAGAFLPQKRSYCTLLGTEALQQQIYWRADSDNRFRATESIISPVPFHWGLDSDFIRGTLIPALEPFSALATRTEPSEIERELLEAVLLYSNATLYTSVAEKLIHILVALESVLLRDETEPIGIAISERMAFMVGQSTDERLEIARDLKSAYRLRSKFIHHGHEVEAVEDLATVERFMHHTWNCFRALAVNVANFSNRFALLDALERRKFS